MKPGTGTITLVATFLVVFGVELASHSAGNEASLLKLGALPDGKHYSCWKSYLPSGEQFGQALLIPLDKPADSWPKGLKKRFTKESEEYMSWKQQ